MLSARPFQRPRSTFGSARWADRTAAPSSGGIISAAPLNITERSENFSSMRGKAKAAAIEPKPNVASVMARIDSKAEHAERRSFALDARRHCRENRQELVAAALSLLRGFIQAGRPRSTPDRLASFEAWDDLIRQCVLWMAGVGIAELGDPTASIATAKERDPERQKLATFLETAASVMGVGSESSRWRTGDLIQKANNAPLHDQEAIALHDVLLEIAGERNSVNPRILGRGIERHTDDRCNGLYVARADERCRAALWRIQRSG